MSLADLLARQTKELAALDREQLNLLLPLFEEAREDLRDRLTFLAKKGEETFSSAQAKATLTQVENSIDVIREQLQDITVEATTLAQDQAVDHLRQQAEYALQNFGSAQRIDLESALQFAEEGGTLLERVNKYSGNWEDAAVKRVKAVLAKAELRKQSIQETIEELVKPGGVMENQRSSARRLVTTELHNGYNERTFEAMKKRAERGDRVIMKRLLNKLDNRTAPDTLAIIAKPGNLVREVEDPFEDPLFGRTFMRPPNRPNDRARLVTFFDTDEEKNAVERERGQAEKQQKENEKKEAELKKQRADGRQAKGKAA